MKTPEENVIETFKGKRVLFLENDNTLQDGLDELENIFKRGEIEYRVLFAVSAIPVEEIISEINSHDAIVFMTQWHSTVSKKIADYMFSIKEKKIVCQAYIHEPTWYYKPETIHDVYIYSCLVHWGKPDKEHETFYKLTEKAYWDYKNNFDK